MAALLHVHTSTAQLLSRGRLSQIPRLNLATQKLALVPCRRSVPISTRPLDSGARATSGQSAGPSEQRKEEAGTGKPWAGRQAGYMPFEYVNFTENHMTHEVSVEVTAPRLTVFTAWQQRENYGRWFDLIGQTILHKENPFLASYFIFYRWGHLPAIELYTTLVREQDDSPSMLADRSVDGMELAASVHFDELTQDSTRVTLRLGYLLPENLMYYVGPVGVWGDVNDILLENMLTMKESIETGEVQ